MSERLFNQALEPVRQFGPVDAKDLALLWAAERLRELEDDRAFLEALIKPAAAGRKPTLTLVRK